MTWYIATDHVPVSHPLKQMFMCGERFQFLPITMVIKLSYFFESRVLINPELCGVRDLASARIAHEQTQ